MLSELFWLITELLKRIEQVSKLAPNEKEHIYITIDALIRDFNAKKAYS